MDGCVDQGLHHQEDIGRAGPADRGGHRHELLVIDLQLDAQGLEKGPGLGALTRPLLARVDRLTVIEIDRDLAAALAAEFPPERLALHVADALTFADAWNVEILASDVGRVALKHAETAIYSGRSLSGVSGKQLAAHFSPVEGGQQVKPRLRKMVTFTQMNLASAVYVGRMDVIFCMNVLIYFSEERRHSLVQRFYDTLEPGGYLFLGHSESISKMPVKFQAIVLNDCILYRKPTAEELQKSELVTEGRS